MPVALPRQVLLAAVLHLPGEIVPRQRRRFRVEHGIGFDGELVPGDVRGFEADRRGQVCHGVRHGLSGQSVHQVNIDIGKSCADGCFNCRYCFIAIVNPAYGRETGVLEALYADGKPVNAQIPISGKTFAVGGARVRFQGYFSSA